MDRIFIEIRINPNRPDHLELEQLVDALKDSGELSDYIRLGLPLITDLKAGRLDMLFYLFPHLRAQFVQDTVQYKTPYEGSEFVEKLVEVAMQAITPVIYLRR